MKNLLLLFIICASCSFNPVTPSLKKNFPDDLGPENLSLALDKHISELEKRPTDPYLSPLAISTPLYIKRLKEFRSSLDQGPIEEKLLRLFRVVSVESGPEDKQIILTGYYSPVIEGNWTPQGRKTRPLYRLPLQPRHIREEIDSQDALKGQELEICYVDPFDAFQIQVQGSGKIIFPDGKSINLSYAGSNGHPYVSLGNKLIEAGVFEKGSVTLKSLETYLRLLSPGKLQKTLNLNPRYIFFQKVTEPDTIAQKQQLHSSVYRR